MTKKESIDSKEFAIQAARIATELNSLDVMVVDLRGISPATDFFVIIGSTSLNTKLSPCGPGRHMSFTFVPGSVNRSFSIQTYGGMSRDAVVP